MVALEPIYNNSYGQGMEGFLNYSNALVNYLLIPFFLSIFFVGGVWLLSDKAYKMGASIAFMGVICTLLVLIAKTFTLVHDFWLFIFAISIGIGLILTFIERS